VTDLGCYKFKVSNKFNLSKCFGILSIIDYLTFHNFLVVLTRQEVAEATFRLSPEGHVYGRVKYYFIL
jgi:hypothetical protein